MQGLVFVLGPLGVRFKGVMDKLKPKNWIKKGGKRGSVVEGGGFWKRGPLFFLEQEDLDKGARRSDPLR